MPTRTHPLVRRLRALRDDRAARDREDVLVAEGIHLAAAALDAGIAIEGALVGEDLLATPEGRALEARLRSAAPVHRASASILDAVQDARAPQPVVVLARRPPAGLAGAIAGRGGPALVVVACGIQDPGNLGAIVRTADAAGATGLITLRGGADLFHPRAVRASAGSVFRLPLAEADAAEVLDGLERARIPLAAAMPGDGEAYDAFPWTDPVALALGGEGAGVPAAVATRAARRVRVPLEPGVESLSVGAAAAVLLFEARRRRRARGGSPTSAG